MANDKDREVYGSGGLRYRADRKVWIASREMPADRSGHRQRLEASGKTEAEATKKLNEKYRDTIRGRAKSRGKGTLKEFLEKWLNDVVFHTLRPKTYRSYRGVCENHIIPAIGNVKLSKLSPDDVRQMRTKIIERCAAADKAGTSRQRGAGPNSARYAQVVLSVALADAVTDGKLTFNPASSQLVKKARVAPKPQSALSVEMSKKLLHTAIKERDPMASRWAGALLTGTRQGETIGLQWSEVNFERREIWFKRQLQQLDNEHGCGIKSDDAWPCGKKAPRACPDRKFILSPEWEGGIEILEGSMALVPVKTEMSKRPIPMCEPLAQILKAHKLETSNQPNPHNLVWHQPSGSPLQPRADYQAWKRALEAADLEPVKLHTTRASTASMLSDMGVDREIIKQILGHTNLETTAGYVSVGETFRREAFEGLGGLLDLFGSTESPAQLTG